MPMKRTCSVEDCENPVLARGWCKTHYRRWQKNGTPLPLLPSVEERFWSKVDKDGPNGCWQWMAGKNPRGYGSFRNGRMVAAHRYAYELLVGPIPEGLHLDHLCRNTSCVNPAHLEPVTCAENIRRGETGINMRSRTHCPQGHPLVEGNLRVYAWKRGIRQCLTCARDQSREYKRAEARRKRGIDV